MDTRPNNQTSRFAGLHLIARDSNGYVLVRSVIRKRNAMSCALPQDYCSNWFRVGLKQGL